MQKPNKQSTQSVHAKTTLKWFAAALAGTLIASSISYANAANDKQLSDASYKNVVLSDSPNTTKLGAKETYDKVLDLFESYYRYTVRYDGDSADAVISGKEWYDDVETVGINRERAKSQFIPYESAAKAFAAQKTVLDNVDASSSAFYKKLSGAKWDFALVHTPEEAEKKDKEWLAKDYKGNEFSKEMVPAAWQTYRNSDGTFKYDEPMYTNIRFPWEMNFQDEDYITPRAPTVYNPVGYYRTSFTLDKNWDGREVFISLQSIESAYYIYVNGKVVGYSTDSYTAHDFNITPYLTEGENTVAIKVFRWSIGSWLENQDFIRQSGIYRDVYLYSKGEAEIRDFFVKTEFTNQKDLLNSDVKLSVETNLRGLKNTQDKDYIVSARLLDKNGNEVAKAEDSVVAVKAAGTSPKAKLLDRGVTNTVSMNVVNPDKWFADTPNLYYLELVLKDLDGKEIESTVERVGFRDLRKVALSEKNKDHKALEQLQINGKQLVFRGVNRHDTDVIKGRAVGFEDYLVDLQTMKQHNLNAIRSSHYPNNAIMYDLADELGLYICIDANIESHRAAFTGAHVPTGPIDKGEYKEFVAPLLDRNATMIEHYKNNPSVVIWSSNNESQYEKIKYNSHSGFWVASMYALKRDPSRFRKSERASAYQDQIQLGDPWSLKSRLANIVDLHSTQYAHPDSVNAYRNVQPYVHSEYNHAMGQAYGNAKEHWDVIRSRDNVNGGFIWDYIDQSILTVDKNDTSKKFWGYGGDWIDTKFNDDAFCGNGLAYADHTPSPKLKDAKKVHQQVNFYLDNDIVSLNDILKIKMVNEYENTPLSNFDITWSIYKNADRSKPMANGTFISNLEGIQGQSLNTNAQYITINLAKVLAGQTIEQGSEYFLDFSVKFKHDTNFGAKAGYEIAHEQFKLAFDDKSTVAIRDDKAIPDFTDVVESDTSVTLKGKTESNQSFKIVLNKTTGTIDSYELDGDQVIMKGPEQSIFRAQTYNDTTAYWSKDSQNAGAFENLKDVQVVFDKASNRVVMHMGANMAVDAAISIDYEVLGNGEIIVLNNFSPKSNFAKVGGLGKFGSRLIIADEFQNFAYFGRGPFDTYVDRENGARIGKYANKVSESYDYKMIRPQENGNHTDVRWTSLTDASGNGLLISSKGNLEVSALPYTAEELNNQVYDDPINRHPIDVPMRKDSVVWSIDYKQRGVSDSAFMGHVPLDGYQVPTNEDYSYSYRISPISAKSDVDSKAFSHYDVQAAKHSVKSIAINGESLANFDENVRSYNVTIPSSANGLDISATGTNIRVIDNRDGSYVVKGFADGIYQEYTLNVVREGDKVKLQNGDVNVVIGEDTNLVDGASKPVPTVTTKEGKTLVDGVDFTVKYHNNTVAHKQGSATIVFKGIYSGKNITKTFNVKDYVSAVNTITFNVDGGSDVPDMTIGSGTLLNPSEIVMPTKKGYSFGGWFNYNFTQAFDFNQPIVQDTTLYVKWNKL